MVGRPSSGPAMREPRAREVGLLVVRTVESCQADLTACFDLLVEAEGSAAAPALQLVQDDLFAVHRALNLLRVQARRLAGVQLEPCQLLRRPAA